MRVERLEREAPCFGVETYPLQRAQAIAKRDQMGALRTIGSKRRGDQQNCAPDLPGIGGLLQIGEDTSRRQIAILRLGRLAGKLPQWNGHILPKRVEDRDE